MKISSYAYNIKTYGAGGNQATHPSVICFDKPWKGYRYYMAYTPYPFGQGAMENPSLCASNDLINWETPNGLINPIANADEHFTDELKDTHLVYNNDLDQIEIWYLGRFHSRLSDNGTLCVYRKVSQDGLNWGAIEEMYRYENFKMVSPSILYYCHTYHFWGIRNDNVEIALYHMESTDARIWSNLEKCKVPDAISSGMWHGAVYKSNEDKYYFVWMGHKGGLNQNENNEQKIRIAESIDGITFTKGRTIIKNRNWDYLYRPCFFVSDNIYHCVYGVVRSDGAWFISESHGSDITQMKEMMYTSGSVRSVNISSTFRTVKNSLLIKNKVAIVLTTIISFAFHLVTYPCLASVAAIAFYILLNFKKISNKVRFLRLFVQGVLIDMTVVYIISFFIN